MRTCLMAAREIVTASFWKCSSTQFDKRPWPWKLLETQPSSWRRGENCLICRPRDHPVGYSRCEWIVIYDELLSKCSISRLWTFHGLVYVDILQSRLDKATELGATAVVNVLSESDRADHNVRKAFGGHDPDAILECSGAESSLQLGTWNWD